jgi:hypothetical protein
VPVGGRARVAAVGWRVVRQAGEAGGRVLDRLRCQITARYCPATQSWHGSRHGMAPSPSPVPTALPQPRSCRSARRQPEIRRRGNDDLNWPTSIRRAADCSRLIELEEIHAAIRVPNEPDRSIIRAVKPWGGLPPADS